MNNSRSQTSINISLKIALDTLDAYRMALYADINCFGFYPSKAMPSVIIILTDGEKMSYEGKIVSNPNLEIAQIKNKNELVA